MLSKQKIKQLYSNLNFPGSYYSSHNFYRELVLKYGSSNVPSYKDVYEILTSIPTFQIHALYKKVKLYRHTDNVTGQGISLQLDLAFMPSVDSYKGFLIAVDEWNNFIYTYPFESKSKENIQSILQSLLSLPTLQHVGIFSSDQGTEFTSNVKYANKKGIKWLFLKSTQKAFLAEIYIRIVKGKLYRAMRDKKTIDWPTLLPSVTQSINETYSSFLKMTPSESNSPLKDPIIRDLWRSRRDKQEVDYANAREKSPQWRVGDFVYKQLKSSPLYKG